ncbi:hypothetical protein, partial [Weissella diestrammenae]
LLTQLKWSNAYSAQGTDPAVYAKLQANIKAAQALLANKRATPAQITAIINALHTTGLAVVSSKTANQPKPAPSTVSDLRQQLKWSVAYSAKGQDAGVYTKLQADIKAANAMLNNKQATPFQIQAAIATLHADGLALQAPKVVATPTQKAQVATQLDFSTKYQLGGHD